jgi:hypothetical protein
LPKRHAAIAGTNVRLRFETVFLFTVWAAVILLVVCYPHFTIG